MTMLQESTENSMLLVQRQTHCSVEQKTKFSNTHIWPNDFQERSQEHTMEEGESLQQSTQRQGTHRTGENTWKPTICKGANMQYMYDMPKLHYEKKKMERTRVKKGKRLKKDIYTKKTDKWPTDLWKDAQQHKSPRKQQSKGQRNTAQHPLDCITQKEKRYCVGKDVNTLDPFYTVSGHVKWCSHLGKQYWGSSHYYK